MRHHAHIVAFASLVFVVMALMPVLAHAQQVPDPIMSDIQWVNLAPDGAIVACPAGDGPTYVEVTVRDDTGAIVEGALVHFGQFPSDGSGYAFHHVCNQNYGVASDAEGKARLYPAMGVSYDEGGPSPTDCGEWCVQAGIMDVGYILWNDTDEYDCRPLHSLDMDTGPSDAVVVNGGATWGDRGILLNDYHTSSCRSDFNGDGFVDRADSLIFNAHAVHPYLCADPYNCECDIRPDTEHTFVCNLYNFGGSDLVWEAIDDCPWLEITPSSGTVPPPESQPPDPVGSQSISIRVDSDGLTYGRYDYRIDFESNDSHFWHTGDYIQVVMNVTPTVSIENSETTWEGLAPYDDAIVVCPSCDAPSFLLVDLRTSEGVPVEGAAVRMELTGSCDYFGGGPTAVTDASGEAILQPCIGLDAPDTDCCSPAISVLAQFGSEPEVEIMSSAQGELQWRSYDLNGDGWVNGGPGDPEDPEDPDWGDYAIFIVDYHTSRCRTDFNGSGEVDMTDYISFVNHAQRPGLFVEGEAGTWTVDEDTWTWDLGDVVEGEEYTTDLTLYNYGNFQVEWWLDSNPCPWLTCSTHGYVGYPESEPPTPDATLVVPLTVNTTGLSPYTEYEYSLPLTSNTAYPYHVPDAFVIRMNQYSSSGVDELLATRLEQNRPNPFNPVTSVDFSIAKPGRVVLRIYDLAGRVVRTLVDGQRAARSYEVMWDGRDDAGNRVASGVYHYALEVDGKRDSRKMILLK